MSTCTTSSTGVGLHVLAFAAAAERYDSATAFLKSFEMLEWLLEHTKKFPKHQRFVMAKRIEDAALSFHDSLLWATKAGKAEGLAPLLDADFHLERLKVYNRLSMKLKLSSFAQYEHLARLLDELGRLLGGWQRRMKGFARKGEEGTGEP